MYVASNPPLRLHLPLAVLPSLLATLLTAASIVHLSAAVYKSDTVSEPNAVFSVDNEAVEGVLGTKVVLGCRVKFTGPYMVVWYKRKRTLTFNNRRVIDDSRFSVATASLLEDVWDLQIDPVQLTDDGDYECIVNTNPPRKKKVKLIVKVPPRINFNVWNGERVLKEGSSHRVPCVATGKPHPNVTWYRERKDEPRQPIGIFDFESNVYVQGSTLTFDRVHRSMEGSYLCVARNGVFPDAKKWIIVIVQFPPQVQVVNNRIGQRIGELTIIQCRVWGNPVGKMSWEFNGTALPKVPACQQNMEPEKLCEEITKTLEDSRRISVELTIRNISWKDYGTYTCVASSVLGVGRATTVLHHGEPEKTQTRGLSTSKVPRTVFDNLSRRLHNYMSWRKREMEPPQKAALAEQPVPTHPPTTPAVMRSSMEERQQPLSSDVPIDKVISDSWHSGSRDSRNSGASTLAPSSTSSSFHLLLLLLLLLSLLCGSQLQCLWNG